MKLLPFERQEGRAATTSVQTGMLLLYAATLLLSAVLLFAIQPMFAKIALPLLGGSPQVWNTAMVFFQAALLLGYGYAHLSVTLLGLRRQIPLHVAVVALGFLTLPIAAVAWAPPTEGTPVPWLIGFLAASIGFPFFVISATAPLLQRWFAATNHPAAHDPYFLYGASNLGSMIALLGYPLLFERVLTIQGQEWAWSAGYVALAVLIVMCGLVTRRHSEAASPRLDTAHLDTDSRPADPITWRQRGVWTLFAFVPSSLLLGVTTYISTHIAAAPLFWVVPLTLYLLTFVLVFARRPIIPHIWMVRLLPFLLIPLALMFGGLPPALGIGGLLLHLLAFFVAAMVSHGELVRRRPSAANLTEFYVWMSVGGVLGGMFNALLAPLVFDGVYEYQLAVVLACLLLPRGTSSRPAFDRRDLILPGMVLAILALPALASWDLGRPLLIILSLAVCVALAASARRPLSFALAFAAVSFFANAVTHQFDRLTQDRSFFGVSRVVIDRSGAFNVLMHGFSVHGAEHRDPARQLETISHYSKDGPFGQFFAALEQRGGFDEVGLIGLGAGTAVCYRQPGQRWTLYEIDPVVVRLAQDTRYFHYLEHCAGDSPILLGDGRISLAAARPQEFDLLIFDAFSSASIPIHLLTRQALALYREKLAEDGVLAFHITTNPYIDLRPIVGDLAADAGLVALIQEHKVTPEMRERDYLKNSIWVVMARTAGDLGSLSSDSRWRRLEPQANRHVWTDDFSDILSAMRWQWPSFMR